MNKKRLKLEFIGNVPCIIDYEENLVYGVIEYVDFYEIASAFEKIEEMLRNE